MAASSNSTSSADAERWYTELEGGRTYILHNSQEKKILVESDAAITVFLTEGEVNSHQMDPRQYYWHCILKHGHFHFRNAFSKKMLRINSQSSFDDSEGGSGDILETGKFNEKEGKFSVLDGSDDQYTLHHNFQGRLFPLSVGYDHHLKIKYLRTFWTTREDAIVKWKFEEVDIKAIEYDPDDFKLWGHSLHLSDFDIHFSGSKKAWNWFCEATIMDFSVHHDSAILWDIVLHENPSLMESESLNFYEILPSWSSYSFNG